MPRINHGPLTGALVRTFLLAVYLLAVYTAVLGAGDLLWPGAGIAESTLLWVLAATVSGLGLTRARRFATGVARRLAPEPTDAPYRTLAELSRRLADASSAEDALPRLARLLADGTSTRTGVWLAFPEGLVLVADSDPGGEAGSDPGARGGEAAGPPLTADGPESLASLSHVDLMVPVTDGDDLLGALTLTRRRRRFVTPRERSLVEDVAPSVSLLLRNARLTAELKERIRQESEQALRVHRSRQRLVTARDTARRQLGEEITAAVVTRLTDVENRAAELRAALVASGGPGPAPDALGTAETRLAEIRSALESAIGSFRIIVAGVYPPTLGDHGLPAALRSLAASAPRKVQVDAADVGRWNTEVESGLYFCAVATLRAWAWSGEGEPIRVALRRHDGWARMSVTHPGCADVQDRTLGVVADRVAALGGSVERTTDGAGCRLSVRVPLPVESPC
ncbi:hypothetical protein [Streptomyces sp.]|uniref:hypothetical protein n=1 Tax=Streptomyces sp. TaxID=1931 RepID=UPI002F3FCC69